MTLEENNHLNLDATEGAANAPGGEKNRDRFYPERRALERIIVDFEARYRNASPDQLDKEIATGLKEVNSFFGGDRVLLWEFSEERQQAHLNYSHVEAGVVQSASLFLDETLPFIFDRILSLEDICVSRLGDLPPSAAIDKQFLEQNGIRSFIIIPLLIGGTLRWAMSLACVRKERIWSNEDLAHFKRIGMVFSSILDHKQSHQALEQRMRFETLISDISGRLIRIPSDQVDGEIERSLNEIMAFFRADCCGLLRVEQERRLIYRTHKCYSKGTEPLLPPEADLLALFPWHYRKVVEEGQPLFVRNMSQIPPEGYQDRGNFEKIGVRSFLSIPLCFGSRVQLILLMYSMSEQYGWSKDVIPRMQVLGEMFLNTLERTRDRLYIEEQLRFEMLLSEISGRFVNLPATQIDNEIEVAQRRVCECLGLDLSVLWQRSAEAPHTFFLTHYYGTFEVQPPPEPMFSIEYFPWSQQQVEEGRISAVSSMEDLPVEAAQDREVLRRFGVKSIITFPLSPGGAMPIGALSFITRQSERAWSEEIITRLQLVAQIFAGALVRNKDETALRESGERLSLITDAVGAGLWSWDFTTGKIWVSQKSREMFHFAPDEDITMESYLRTLHPDDMDWVWQEMQKAILHGESVSYQYRIIKPDGALRWISVRAHGFLKPNGETDRVLGLSLDVTDRKLFEEELQKSEERILALVENTDDMIWSVDARTCGLLTFNSAFKSYFSGNYDIEVMQGMTPAQLLPKPHAGRIYEIYARALQEGSFITEYITPTNSHILLLSVNCLKFGEEIFGISVFGRDITERKRAEKELRQSEERFKLVAENVTDFIWEIDEEGLYRYTSPAVKKILGYAPDEIIGKVHFYDFFIPEIREELKASALKVIASKKPFYAFHNMNVSKDGHIVHLETTGVPMLDEAGNYTGYCGSDTDVTVRKEIENEVMQYQHRLKSLVSQLAISEERERRSIAVDLHDYIGHSLALARMQAEEALKSSSPIKTTMLLKDISKILLKTIQDCKDLIFELSSGSINKLGMADTIAEWLEEYLGRRHSIEIEIINHSNHKRLDNDLEAILFRNVRELSINVIKHAYAKKMSVLFEDTAEALKIIITDDGVGFDPESPQILSARESGFGLFSIQERMSDLGGSLEIISAPGKGCKAVLTAPWAINSHEA